MRHRRALLLTAARYAWPLAAVDIGGGSENPIIVPSGARTWATSKPHGMRLGATIGTAPASTAYCRRWLWCV